MNAIKAIRLVIKAGTGSSRGGGNGAMVVVSAAVVVAAVVVAFGFVNENAVSSKSLLRLAS